MKVRVCYLQHNLSRNLHSYQYDIVDFNKILEISDFLSIHVPLAQNTYQLIGEKELKKMKQGSFLINSARGGIVDEKALFKILSKETGNIRGAAIDTHEFEKLIYKSPLCGLKRVILTPHIAGTTYESTSKSLDILVSKVVHSINESIK